MNFLKFIAKTLRDDAFQRGIIDFIERVAQEFDKDDAVSFYWRELEPQPEHEQERSQRAAYVQPEPVSAADPVQVTLTDPSTGRQFSIPASAFQQVVDAMSGMAGSSRGAPVLNTEYVQRVMTKDGPKTKYVRVLGGHVTREFYEKRRDEQTDKSAAAHWPAWESIP